MLRIRSHIGSSRISGAVQPMFGVTALLCGTDDCHDVVARLQIGGAKL